MLESTISLPFVKSSAVRLLSALSLPEMCLTDLVELLLSKVMECRRLHQRQLLKKHMMFSQVRATLRNRSQYLLYCMLRHAFKAVLVYCCRVWKQKSSTKMEMVRLVSNFGSFILSLTDAFAIEVGNNQRGELWMKGIYVKTRCWWVTTQRMNNMFQRTKHHVGL